MSTPLQLYLEKNSIEENRFYGRFIQTNNNAFVFTNVISKSEGNLLINEKGNRENVWLGFRNDGFKEGKYYEFSIFIKGENQLPNIDLFNNPPLKSDKNPYEEIVFDRYNRLDRPESNKIIANLLREIGKGMYSSKERMIFELLQNADDAPAGEELKFHIDTHHEYLLIMHNGLPFSKSDVGAITSAAQSTKKNDKKKTGYKGIGFKSVFTDSSEVIIKSGGFIFQFDREYSAYKDFDTFYFDREDYKIAPQLISRHKRKWEAEAKSFNGNKDVPWQLLPIWKNEIASELNNSRLVEYNNNVGIALKINRKVIEDYLEAVDTIAENPVFLLFLRHIKVFKSFKNGLTIRKKGENPVQIIKQKGRDYTYERFYFKKECDEISINQDSFKNEGLTVFRNEEVNDYGEVSYFLSRDEEGKDKIDNIPPKIAAAESTLITFAAPIINNKLGCEPDYLLDKDFNSFFTYLPLTEKRINLPFLVNADFVLSSNREGIQGDNEWNIFLFAKIGRLYLNWLKEIAELGISQNSLHPEYLSLLLKKPLTDQKEVQALINVFNEIYLETLEDTAFIVDYRNELRTCSEIIIDETGLTSLFGEEVFYAIQNEDKYLVLDGINTNYLKYQYLDIALFDFSYLIEILEKEENIEILKLNFKKSDIVSQVKYQKWVEDNVGVLGKLALELFFIPVESEIYSLNFITEYDDFFLRINENIPVTILNNLGLKGVELKYSDFPKLIDVVTSEDNYLNPIKGKLTFEKLTFERDFTSLSSKEKSWFINFLQNLKGIGPDTWGKELKLFKSQSGNLKAIQELTSNASETIPNWLNEFIIDRDEERTLSAKVLDELIPRADIFDTIICNPSNFTSITELVDVPKELDSFYTYCLECYEEIPETERRNISNIPWLYNERNNTFQLANELYFPVGLHKAKESEYKRYALLIEENTALLIPHHSSVELKKTFKLGGNTDNIQGHIPRNMGLSLEDSNLLLDFLKVNKEDNFLLHSYFEETEGTYFHHETARIRTYFSKNKNLISLIEDIDDSNLILLPNDLYQTGLETIGLLEGEELIEYLLDINYGNIAFVDFLYPYKAKETLCSKFIANISAFNINSQAEYSKSSPEFKVIELVLGQEKEKITQFRQIIILDGELLSEKSVSDDIWFPTIKKELKLRLSDLFPSDFEGNAYSLNQMLELFSGVGKVSELKELFKVRKYRFKDEIAKKLLETTDKRFSAKDCTFWHFYMLETGEVDILSESTTFLDLFESNRVLYEEECIKFLDYCVLESIENPFDFFSFPDFVPAEKIWSEKYALESELVPNWLKTWISGNDSKISYLTNSVVGLNHDESNVVKFRIGVEDNNKSAQDITRSLLSDLQLRNSLIWLKENTRSIQLSSVSLKNIYETFEERNVSIKTLLIPVIIEGQVVLKSWNKDDIYHLENSKWEEYVPDIIKAINHNDQFVLNEVLPSSFTIELDAIEEGFLEVLDTNKLIASDKLEELNLGFYQSLKNHANASIIKVYNDTTLPYRFRYHDIIDVEVDLKIDYEVLETGEIIVCQNQIENIPEVIRSELNNDFFTSLLEKKFGSEKNESFQEIDLSKSDYQFSPEEVDALNVLFDGQPPEEFYKDWNVAALVKALIYLPQIGYDVTEAKKLLAESHKYAQLESVFINGDSESEYLIMGRSAANGLLYLTTQAWERLKGNKVHLFVNFGGTQKVFQNQQAVLDYAMESSDFQIMRIMTEPTAENINDVLSGNFDKKKVWLVFKMKSDEKIDHLFKRWEPNDKFDTDSNREGITPDENMI